MDLPQNQSYGSQNFDIGKVTKAFQRVASSLGPRPSKRQYAQSGTISSPANYSALSGKVSTELSKLGRVSVPYGGGTKYEKFHPAIDIANKFGTPIPFYSSGKVTEVVTGKRQGDPWSGNYVVVQDNDGNKWRYSHLSSSYVKVGDTVQKGQVAMAMGNSGYTYSSSGGDASHLDLRIRNFAGKYISPYSLIN